MISKNIEFKIPHLAWIFMFASILIWSGMSGQIERSTLGNTGNWYRILLVVISGCLVLLSLLRYGNRSFANASLPILLLGIYGVIAFFSSLLIPEHAFYVMWKSIEIILDVLIIIALLGSGKPLDAIWKAYQILLALFLLLLALAWFGAFIKPTTAFIPSRGLIPYTISGIYPVQNGNSLAFVSAVVAYTQVCKLIRTKRRITTRVLLISVAIITLVVAQSRTSLVGLIIALVVFLYYDKQRKLLLWTMVPIFIIGLFTGLATIFTEYFMRSQSTELFLSLSGRTRAWEGAMKLFFENPIIGNGFAAAARVRVLGVSGASTLHGAVFDVLVGVGVIGFIPWVSAIIIGAKRLHKLKFVKHKWMQSKTGRSIHAEMIGLFVLIIIRSSTSSGISMHESTFMFLLIVLAYIGILPRVMRSATVTS